MKIWQLVIIVMVVGCVHSDPIDRVVAKASASDTFPSGLFEPLLLPETASVSQIVSHVFTNFTILDTRQVRIRKSLAFLPEYTAVFLSTKSGRKVILLKFEKGYYGYPSEHGWWSRIYDIE